nr:ADP-ribosylglycohydrolase family protein [Myxococcota bacterium]
TLEFTPRDSVEPIRDLVGGGPFGLKAGEWTDDTSMALCLATSLIERRGFDPRDQMNRFCNWADFGYLSSNGRSFDIGNTVAAALATYRATAEPFAGSTDPNTAGNGSLMRLAPVVLFFYPDRSRAIEFAAESSRTTHGAAECLCACKIFAELLIRALSGDSRSSVLSPVSCEACSPALESVARLDFIGKTRSQIRGSGYVVHCLEAALWCFSETRSFRDAVLLAANLGEDADTTAAVCGQLAGAYYGASGIPGAWLERLVMREEMTTLAARLREASA